MAEDWAYGKHKPGRAGCPKCLRDSGQNCRRNSRKGCGGDGGGGDILVREWVRVSDGLGSSGR